MTCKEKCWVSKIEKSGKEKVKVCKMQRVEEPYEYWVCTPHAKKEKVMVDRCKLVPTKKMEEYWVCTPHMTEKEVEVKVCKKGEKTVKVKVPVYGHVETSCSSGCCK